MRAGRLSRRIGGVVAAVLLLLVWLASDYRRPREKGAAAANAGLPRAYRTAPRLDPFPPPNGRRHGIATPE